MRVASDGAPHIPHRTSHVVYQAPGTTYPVLRVGGTPVWPIVSPPDAKWKAPYSARFHVGASAPGG